MRRILTAAEGIFAEFGYKGATIQQIADRAGLPKANIHYYFSTKEILYRKVLDDILQVWLEAADPSDDWSDPVPTLTRYINAKMELSRTRPKGSKVWANEIIQGAPMIQNYLESTLRIWMQDRTEQIRSWVEAGKIRPVDPYHLLYMIWAVTQHYADFEHQINTLNGNKALSEKQFAQAKQNITETLLRGIGALHGSTGRPA
ncbi:MAG TPA: TetR/AcrR family transcriptional regulator [Candidatus Lambdaproteobacteria bacterium]|nr:TetR/AcrR family transcriptional regulator [Candidatus Lambdaproteobacteria bacterium]